MTYHWNLHFSLFKQCCIIYLLIEHLVYDKPNIPLRISISLYVQWHQNQRHSKSQTPCNSLNLKEASEFSIKQFQAPQIRIEHKPHQFKSHKQKTKTNLKRERTDLNVGSQKRELQGPAELDAGGDGATENKSGQTTILFLSGKRRRRRRRMRRRRRRRRRIEIDPVVWGGGVDVDVDDSNHFHFRRIVLQVLVRKPDRRWLGLPRHDSDADSVAISYNRLTFKKLSILSLGRWLFWKRDLDVEFGFGFKEIREKLQSEFSAGTVVWMCQRKRQRSVCIALLRCSTTKSHMLHTKNK